MLTTPVAVVVLSRLPFPKKLIWTRVVQDGVVRNLQILTESSQRVSSELKTQYPSVDWRGLSGLRNVLVHEYFGINNWESDVAFAKLKISPAP